jgi:hypothetical protein
MNHRFVFVWLLVAAALSVIGDSSAHAVWEVAGIFGDNMVLQQQQGNPVWGRTDPDGAVRVELAGATAEVQADGDTLPKS